MPDGCIVPKQLIIAPLALQSAQVESKSYVFVFTSEPNGWSLNKDVDWISVIARQVNPDYVQWELSFEKNRDHDRVANLKVTGPDRSILVKVGQAGGVWIEQQASMVLLDPPPPSQTERLAFPLAMELGAAGKFIAQQLAKLPPPAKAAASTAVYALIAGLGVAAIATRNAFTTVPEPPDYFQPQTAFTQPMTTALIQQQTARLIAYITEELATQG
jgi:hypothetical protein